MMKSLLACPGAVILALSISTAYAQNTKLIIQSGTTMTAGGSLVLSNTDLQCDGALNASTVTSTGTANTSFNGAGTPVFETFNLNTTTGAVLTLNSPLQISSLLNFQQGQINLNGQNLTLTGNAQLQNESETSYITGITGGSVIASATGVTAPSQLNIGGLGAALTSSSSLGNVTISRSHQPITNSSNTSLHSIQRSYLIQPQFNSGLAATLRFYYLNAELAGADPSTLSLWKSADGVNWQLIGADTRNAASKYVEKTGIADLSYWTLSDASNPLPLTLVSFSATCESGYALLNWTTAQESDLTWILVEESTDGSNWNTLGKVAATNNPSGASYSYKDEHPQQGALYRLQILSFSGSSSYSPVFRGDCEEVAMPLMVYPNPAQSQATAEVSVRQNTKATLSILDMGGRLLYTADWSLATGINQLVLPVSGLSAGSYILQLRTPGGTQHTTLVKK